MVNFQSARCRQRSRATKSARRAGFTLVEVLLVLAILGAIAAMVVPDLLSRQNKAQSDSVLISIKATEQALKMYAIDHGGKWPKCEMAIKTLLEARSIRGVMSCDVVSPKIPDLDSRFSQWVRTEKKALMTT